MHIIYMCVFILTQISKFLSFSIPAPKEVGKLCSPILKKNKLLSNMVNLFVMEDVTSIQLCLLPPSQLLYTYVHYELTVYIVYTTLFKKYPTLFFPGKTSDGRLANLITVVGGPSWYIWVFRTCTFTNGCIAYSFHSLKYICKELWWRK
jgi:hypothetical protein